MGGDVDGDGICNNADNCPDHPNPGQENCNGSDSGDVCEIADCPAMDPACFDCNANGVPGACDDPPAYTTVMTLMNQLAAKGAFEVDRCRQPFVYCPAVRRDQVLNQRIRHFLHTVFDGQAGELVLRLVDDDRLSHADLKRIEARIEARERAGERKNASPATHANKAARGREQRRAGYNRTLIRSGPRPTAEAEPAR